MFTRWREMPISRDASEGVIPACRQSNSWRSRRVSDLGGSGVGSCGMQPRYAQPPHQGRDRADVREGEQQGIDIDPELLALARRRRMAKARAATDPDKTLRSAAAGLAASENVRRRQADARRQQLLAAVRAEPTTTIGEHLKALGFSPKQYQTWRSGHPAWRDQLDAARNEIGGGRPYQHGFAKWRWEFLGRQTFPHQQVIVDAIESAPTLSVTLILVPPEAGKTTIMEEYCAYLISGNPSVRIQYWAKNPTEARKRIMRVKAILTEPGATRGADGIFGKIIGRFGPFYQKGQELLRPWRAEEFTVYKAPLRERDGTMEAKGIKTNTQGTRAELIVFDDVQDLNNLNDSEIILKKIRQEGSTRLSEPTGGKAIWVGTRVEVNDIFDLMYQLPESEWFLHQVIEIPAVNEKGESYCPEMHPIEVLERRKKLVGTEAWWRCYMMSPLSAGRMTFPGENIRAAKKSKMTWGTAVPGMPCILTVDPALSPGICAFLVSSVVDPDHLRLVELTRHHNFASLAHITAEIERLAIAYPALSDLVVEDNFFRGALTQDPEFLRIVAKYKLNVVEHITGRNKQHHDMGITALGRGFTRGEIEIPDGDRESQVMFKWGCEQLEKWKPGVPDKIIKQDFVIVLWMAWLQLASIRADLESRNKQNLEQWRRHQAATFQPMSRRQSA